MPLCKLVSPLSQDHMEETTEIQRKFPPSPGQPSIHRQTVMAFIPTLVSSRRGQWEKDPVGFGRLGKGSAASVQLGKNSTVLYTVYLINDFFEYERFYYTSAIL